MSKKFFLISPIILKGIKEIFFKKYSLGETHFAPARRGKYYWINLANEVFLAIAIPK